MTNKLLILLGSLAALYLLTSIPLSRWFTFQRGAIPGSISGIRRKDRVGPRENT